MYLGCQEQEILGIVLLPLGQGRAFKEKSKAISPTEVKKVCTPPPTPSASYFWLTLLRQPTEADFIAVARQDVFTPVTLMWKFFAED